MKVPITITNVPIEMELDTGAAVSIMNHVDYCKHFGHIPMQQVHRV